MKVNSRRFYCLIQKCLISRTVRGQMKRRILIVVFLLSKEHNC